MALKLFQEQRTKIKYYIKVANIAVITWEIIGLWELVSQEPVDKTKIYISYCKSHYQTSVINKGEINDEINFHIKMSYFYRFIIYSFFFTKMYIDAWKDVLKKAVIFDHHFQEENL